MSGWTHHLSDDQLIDRLYGIRGTNDAHGAHLEECAECAARWDALRARRGNLVEEAPETGVLWTEQRRQILERVEGGAEASWNWQRAWAPVLLTALVLAAGVWFYGPFSAPPPAPAPVAVDTSAPGWFEDTYSVMQPDEPRAAGPIRVLFEQQEEKVTE